jgi:putative oxidoreductase
MTRRLALEALPLRLHPGDDLREALGAALLSREGSAAWVIAGIGSLSAARLRFAGIERPELISGDLEILTLAGTPRAWGARGARLHGADHRRIAGRMAARMAVHPRLRPRDRLRRIAHFRQPAGAPMIRSDDTGKFVLRVALGAMLLIHGISKLGSGVGAISGMLAEHGLPGALAYLVFVAELLAPLLLILGLYTRPAAWIIVIDMLFAIGLVHLKDLWMIGRSGGWARELEGFYLFGAVAVAFLGAGRFSLGGSSGRMN